MLTCKHLINGGYCSIDIVLGDISMPRCGLVKRGTKVLAEDRHFDECKCCEPVDVTNVLAILKFNGGDCIHGIILRDLGDMKVERYATHAIMADGSFKNGHHFSTFAKARKDFSQRVTDTLVDNLDSTKFLQVLSRKL